MHLMEESVQRLLDEGRIEGDAASLAGFGGRHEGLLPRGWIT